MNQLEFDLVRSILAKEADGELVTKGPDYAHHDTGTGELDRLANFKEVAHRLEGAPMDLTTVCAVYFEKHVVAIERAVKDRKLSSEALIGRFADARNYLDLLLACFAESDPLMVPKLSADLYEAPPAEAEIPQVGCGSPDCYCCGKETD